VKGEACSVHGRGDECIHKFGQETRREETTWKTQTQMGG